MKHNYDDSNLKEYIIKEKNYLKQKQKFFDLADNIQDERLKKSIIYQMLTCEQTIINIIEKSKKAK